MEVSFYFVCVLLSLSHDTDKSNLQFQRIKIIISIKRRKLQTNYVSGAVKYLGMLHERNRLLNYN